MAGLENVTFEWDEPGYLVTSYGRQDILNRFGPLMLNIMNVQELQNALGTNMQISEYYFAHYSRFYIGEKSEMIAYRVGEPNEKIALPYGGECWMYEMESVSTDRFAYYFTEDGLLTATRYFTEEGIGYEQLVGVLGLPGHTEAAMQNGDIWLAFYELREGGGRYAYFVLRNRKVVEEGVMFGLDYKALLV